MLGMMYALVAVGFSLFFGVLDVIQFAHGDVLMVGAFAGLAAHALLDHVGVTSPALLLVGVLAAAALSMAILGALIARAVVLPLKSVPPINVLLMTLMLGTALRESIRLFYPGGSQPQRFPSLLPGTATAVGALTLRLDNAVLLTTRASLRLAT